MTKKIILTVLFAVLFALATVGILFAQGSSDAGTNGAAVDGPYVEYTEAGFDAASDMVRVYFFHASWCPSCRDANREINGRLEDVPEGARIFKADYDDNVELKKMFGVTYQHTFVIVDSDGNQLSKWTGGDMDKILSEIAKYI